VGKSAGCIKVTLFYRGPLHSVVWYCRCVGVRCRRRNTRARTASSVRSIISYSNVDKAPWCSTRALHIHAYTCI